MLPLFFDFSNFSRVSSFLSICEVNLIGIIYWINCPGLFHPKPFQVDRLTGSENTVADFRRMYEQ